MTLKMLNENNNNNFRTCHIFLHGTGIYLLAVEFMVFSTT